MAFNIRTSRPGVTAELEIFKFPPNAQGFASIVLDANSVAADAAGRRVLKAGTPLSKNSNNQYERFTSAVAANEVNRLVIDATGGTYKLNVGIGIANPKTTAAIAFNATALALKAAIDAVGGVVTTVTGTGTAADAYVITFTTPASQDVTMTSDAALLTGGARTATITTTTEGDTAQTVRGILAHAVEFPDGTAKSDTPAALAFHGEVFRADRIVDFATHGGAIRAALPTCRFD